MKLISKLKEYFPNKCCERECADYKEKQRDKKVLERYRRGNSLRPEDLDILERYQTTGIVRLGGFNYSTGLAEASLTDRGKWYLKQL